MTSFDAIADVIETLPRIVRDVRKTLGLSLRATSDETGISLNTLSRFDRGLPVSQEHTLTLLRWLEKRHHDALTATWNRRERLEGWAVSNDAGRT